MTFYKTLCCYCNKENDFKFGQLYEKEKSKMSLHEMTYILINIHIMYKVIGLLLAECASQFIFISFYYIMHV